MSPVGHSLTGLAIAALVLPPSRKSPRLWLGACTFVALANLPDWPLPGWGHDRYDISHSLFVNLALICGIALCCQTNPAWRVPPRLFLCASSAWLSHLLLDSFYQHRQGIDIGWPFLDWRLNFPFPFFHTVNLNLSPLHPTNLSVFAIEAIAFSPILALALWLRHLAAHRPLT